MGWAEDYLNQQKGQRDAALAGSSQSSYLGGFISSAASGFITSFGGDPLASSLEFEKTNPWSAFTGEMVGAVAPYVAGGWLSTTAKGAALLEGAMAKTGLNAITSPIKYGAVKEVLRYTPVELSRL